MNKQMKCTNKMYIIKHCVLFRSPSVWYHRFNSLHVLWNVIHFRCPRQHWLWVDIGGDIWQDWCRQQSMVVLCQHELGRIDTRRCRHVSIYQHPAFIRHPMCAKKPSFLNLLASMQCPAIVTPASWYQSFIFNNKLAMRYVVTFCSLAKLLCTPYL